MAWQRKEWHLTGSRNIFTEKVAFGINWGLEWDIWLWLRHSVKKGSALKDVSGFTSPVGLGAGEFLRMPKQKMKLTTWGEVFKSSNPDSVALEITVAQKICLLIFTTSYGQRVDMDPVHRESMGRNFANVVGGWISAESQRVEEHGKWPKCWFFQFYDRFFITCQASLVLTSTPVF